LILFKLFLKTKDWQIIMSRLKANLILVNGQVVTIGKNNNVHQAIAIIGNHIVAVGTTDELMDLRGPTTRVVDVKEKSILPGLIDSHAHIASQGFRKNDVDCGYENVQSINEIKRKIMEAAQKKQPGEWIRAWGYNEEYLADKRHPTRDDLDAAAPNNPVYLGRVCYHIAVLNSKGLELAGVDRNSQDPLGGRIGRDIDGEPNGILFEAASRVGKQASVPSVRELRAALKTGAKEFLRHGITSVHDAGSYGSQQLKILKELNKIGVVLPRVYMMAYSAVDERELLDNFTEAGISTGFGDQFLRIGPVKRITDGDATAATAGLRNDYLGRRGDKGFIYTSSEELGDFFIRANRQGFQLTAHAAGDRAIEIVLQAIAMAMDDKYHPDPRPRIEHCAVLDPGLMGLIKELRVIPVLQPAMFYDFGDMFLREYGEDRCKYMFPCQSLLQMGIPVVASSDAPVTTLDPLFGIYEAMTRITNSGEIVGHEERVNLEQAIRMYTINGAYASFEENIKGSLEVGKLADIVVLSDAILGKSKENIRSMQVEMTIIDGEVVYDTGVL
jgi:hypothetical protein